MSQDPSVIARSSILKVALVVPIVALIAVLATRWVQGPSVTSVAKGGANVIVIQNFSFQPARLTVANGATVTVNNADRVPHTLSSRDGSFDTRVLGAGKSATIVLKQSGSFPYSCQIHPSMAGNLVVK